MKKFAAIFAAVIFTVSVFIVSASASDLTREEMELEISRDEDLRSVPNVSSGYPYDVIFNPDPSAPASGMSVSFSCNGVTYGSIGVGDHEGHSWLYFWGSGGIGFLYVYDFDSSVWASDSYRYITLNSMPPESARAWLSANTYVSVFPTVSGVVGSVFSVGSSLISFVTSSWLTLLALVAFVAVLCLSVVRRLVKGV